MNEGAASVIQCALCNVPLVEGPQRYVNQQVVCPACEQQVLAELEGQKAGATHYPTALVGGLVGAILGAGVWAAIGIITSFEVGYIAVLVGFLAGLGVKLGARKKGALGLQLMAAGLSVFGLLCAKYFYFAWAMVQEAQKNGLEISYLNGDLLRLFPEVLPNMVNGFDILWLFLAVGAAFKLPAPPKVDVYSA